MVAARFCPRQSEVLQSRCCSYKKLHLLFQLKVCCDLSKTPWIADLLQLPSRMLSAMAVKTGEALWKRFIREYKLSVPIVSAPMAGVAGAELASSVARAGGMGFIGASQYEHGEQLQRHVIC